MPSVAASLTAATAEGMGSRGTATGVPAPDQPIVRSLVTRLPADAEVWDPSYRPEPGWQFQDLQSLLVDRNRELQMAAADGWVLQTTVSISSPADGGVTILDTLWRSPLQAGGSSAAL
jgi:hypothetical protein